MKSLQNYTEEDMIRIDMELKEAVRKLHYQLDKTRDDLIKWMFIFAVSKILVFYLFCRYFFS